MLTLKCMGLMALVFAFAFGMVHYDVSTHVRNVMQTHTAAYIMFGVLCLAVLAFIITLLRGLYMFLKWLVWEPYKAWRKGDADDSTKE